MPLSFIQAARLLVEIANTPPRSALPAGITRERIFLPGGGEYDRYSDGRPRPRGIVSVISGMVPEGERDDRLVHFARVLAKNGFIAACPALPGLKSFQLLPSDLDVLLETTAQETEIHGTKTGVIGFSFGAGMALTAACHPRAIHRVHTVISFGAYHNLLQQWRDMVSKDAQYRPDRDSLYRQLVLAFVHRDTAGFDPDHVRHIEELLHRYCVQRPSKEMCDFVSDTLLPKRDAYYRPPFREADAAVLSCAGKLHFARARLFLLHDPHDGSVNVSHARAVYSELTGHGKTTGSHRLLVTPLISHVDVGERRLMDGLRMTALFAAYLRETDRASKRGRPTAMEHA